MKFAISTQELNYLMNKVQHIVSLKPTLPLLANLCFEAYDDTLTLTATDLTVGIRCSTETKILEEGSTTLPAKRFAQLIKELPAPVVEVTTQDNDISTIVAGASRFKLNGMSQSEFPAFPDFSQASSITLPADKLKNLLYHTAFAVSRENTRYVLTGVLFCITNGSAVFVGTDGKRLAKSYTALDVPASLHHQMIIPLKALEEILKNLEGEEEVTLFFMPDKLMLKFGQTLLWTKLLVGDYPEVDLIIPAKSSLIIPLHREELISLLKQVSPLIAKPHQSIRFIFTEGELNLSVQSTDIGEGYAGMPVQYTGPKFEIAFNPGSFLGILGHCQEDTITIGLTDPYNLGIIVDGFVENNLHLASPLFVLMPMALSDK